MVAHRLQLNQNKTEVLWRSSARCEYHILASSVQVGRTSVQPVSTVRNSDGVHLDADVRMHNHVTAVIRACFATPRQIRSIRHGLLHSTLVSMIHALVLSKTDYCKQYKQVCLNGFYGIFSSSRTGQRG